MAALKLDMTIPLGTAGHIRLAVDITDLAATAATDREFLADTISEFCAFAARTLTPAAPSAMIDPPRIHDPSASVIAGVTGSRIRDKL